MRIGYGLDAGLQRLRLAGLSTAIEARDVVIFGLESGTDRPRASVASLATARE